jgi:hypothetical protein
MKLKHALKPLLPVAALAFGGCHEKNPAVTRDVAPVPTMKTPEAQPPAAPAPSSSASGEELQRGYRYPSSTPEEKSPADNIRWWLDHDGVTDVKRAREEESPTLKNKIAKGVYPFDGDPSLAGPFCFSGKKKGESRTRVFCGDVVPGSPVDESGKNGDSSSILFEMVRPDAKEPCPDARQSAPFGLLCLKGSKLIS